MRQSLSPGWQMHLAFGMQAQADAFTAPQPFIDAGFTGFGVATLTLQRSGLLASPTVPAARFEQRPLRLPAEVSGVVDLNMASNDEDCEPEGYRQFRSHQMQRYSDMAAAGMGHWCRALVHAACRHGLAHMGWHALVMGADPDDVAIVAIGIYRSVGFQQHDTLWMLERRAPQDQAGD